MNRSDRLDGTMTRIEGGEKVALVAYDGPLDDHEPVAIDLDQWGDFIEKCKDMGWQHAQLHVKDGTPILASHPDDDGGDTYVAISPMVEEDTDGKRPENHTPDAGGDEDDW